MNDTDAMIEQTAAILYYESGHPISNFPSEDEETKASYRRLAEIELSEVFCPGGDRS